MPGERSPSAIEVTKDGWKQDHFQEELWAIKNAQGNISRFVAKLNFEVKAWGVKWNRKKLLRKVQQQKN